MCIRDRGRGAYIGLGNAGGAALLQAAGNVFVEAATGDVCLLYTSLNGRVALLHLGTAGFQARQFVRLGRTRCAADAVTARAAALANISSLPAALTMQWTCMSISVAKNLVLIPC